MTENYKSWLSTVRLNDSQQNYKVYLKTFTEATDKQIAALQAIYFVKKKMPENLTKKGIFDFISNNPKEPEQTKEETQENKQEQTDSIIGQLFKL